MKKSVMGGTGQLLGVSEVL